MNDIPNWLIALAAIIGAPLGAYLGVRVGLTRVETQMGFVMEEIKKLWLWIKDHDEIDRQWYAKVEVLAERIEAIRRD